MEWRTRTRGMTPSNLDWGKSTLARVRGVRKPRWGTYGMGNDMRTGTRAPTQEVSRARGSLNLDVKVGKQEEATFLAGAWVMGGLSFRNMNTEGGVSMGKDDELSVSQCPLVVPWWHPCGNGKWRYNLGFAEMQRLGFLQFKCIQLTPETMFKYKFLLSKYLVGPRNLHF